MTDRGQDSAGIAIYKNDNKSLSRVTVQSNQPEQDFASLQNILTKKETTSEITIIDTHAVITVASNSIKTVRQVRL